MARARILAADDQLYFRQFIADYLAEEDFEVHAAASLSQLREALEVHPTDVVLLDITLVADATAQGVESLLSDWPGLAVIVLADADQVRLAAEALKGGARDYLVKPIDRAALLRSIENILERQALHRDRESLERENRSYAATLARYDRAGALTAIQDPEDLRTRFVAEWVDAFDARGAVLWLESGRRLAVCAAVGELPPAAEIPAIDPNVEGSLREELAREPAAPFFAPLPGDASVNMAWVAIRDADGLRGCAALRIDDDAPPALEGLLPFVSIAAPALLRTVPHSRAASDVIRDPVTQAFTLSFLENVIRNEIETAKRFGRHFSILRLDLEPLTSLRRAMPEVEFGAWLAKIVERVGGLLRSADVIASETESAYRVFLPETDALGAAAIARRIRDRLVRSDDLAPVAGAARPELLLATASYPADGGEGPALEEVLAQRIQDDRQSLVHAIARESESFAQSLDTLLDRSSPGNPQILDQVASFVIDEMERRSRDRCVLFLAPGVELTAATRDRIEALQGRGLAGEIVLLEDRGDAATPPVTRVSIRRAGTRAPFLLFYGEGPAYGMVREPAATADGTPYFHTSDRSLVHHLAYQLQTDLGIALGL